MYVLSNKKPEWNDRVGGYMLNFKGRAKKASIKNFIIEDETKESEDPDEREIMMFGKLDED